MFGVAEDIDLTGLVGRKLQRISVGVDRLELGFDDDFLLFSMPFYGQYDFGNVPGEVPILMDMHPFARLGLGFTYAEIDTRFFDVDNLISGLESGILPFDELNDISAMIQKGAKIPTICIHG